MARHWRPAAAALLVLVAACGDRSDRQDSNDPSLPADGPLEFCQGPQRLLYDAPLTRTTIPDDVFTVEDPSTLTGLRLSFANAQDVPGSASRRYYADLETLDGWGITAPLVLQFSARPDEATLPVRDNVAPAPADSVQLVELAGEVRRIPISWELVEEDDDSSTTNLIVSPLVPLMPRTRHALMVTTGLEDRERHCFAPSAVMKSVLDGSVTEPSLRRLQNRVVAATNALIDIASIADASDLTSLTVFTTQHTIEDDIEVAKLVEAMEPDYRFPDGCSAGSGNFLVCDGTFRSADFRQDGRWVDSADLSPQRYRDDIPVVVYRPLEGQQPFPTIFMGHGLGGDRFDAESLAETFTSKGWAIVAADAVKHGDHPDGPPIELILLPDIVKRIFAFFGMSVPYELEKLFDPLAQRDNWRQSQFDRLQLIQAMRIGLDADGDGASDLTTEKLYYFGASMGGIMAAELVSLVPEFDLVITIVPGARVGGIIRDSEYFDLAMIYLRTKALEGLVHRLFSVWQTIIDRGDAAAFTRHMVRERLPGMPKAPPTLMMMVKGDSVVPNTSNALYARGLGVPHVGEVIVPIGVIDHQPDLPIQGNLSGGSTGGMFQYDVVFEGQGPELEPATHMNLSRNDVALEQAVHFIETFEATGVAEIIDPYVVLGIKP